MSKVDNFSTMAAFLPMDKSEDLFMFVQILKRKKENPNLGSNSKVIKTYRINNFQHLSEKKEEMIKLAELFNARVVAHPTLRSYSQIGLQLLKQNTDSLLNKAEGRMFRNYDSVCGKFPAQHCHKYWIIDIDSKSRDLLKDIITFISDRFKVHASLLKTPSGFHLIATPFDTRELVEIYGVGVQRNNPTVVYANIK